MKTNQTKPAFASLLDLALKLDQSARNVCLLGGNGESGWTSRLAFNPVDKLVLKKPNADLNKLLNFIKSNKTNLVVGYISYDLGCQLQAVANKKPDDLKLPDIYFLAFDKYLEEKAGVIRNPGELELPRQNNALKSSPGTRSKTFQAEQKRADYNKSFDRIQEYIKSGHIYQINLTHRLMGRSSVDPRRLFSKIARHNQASMMGYLEAEDFEILSFSPERFVKTKGSHITSSPIKGTRLKTSDEKLSASRLLNNSKEASELNMITDLIRNDLAKVCLPGSVKVTKKRRLQSLTNLIHTFSELSGTLKSHISPIEAFLSMFPGGSIAGCPKKRAMEIIEELEAKNRGVYCGSLVCIDPSGNLDSNILIRTVIKKAYDLILPVGGGIVFDSNVDEEYQETLDKALSIINCFKN